MYTEVYYYLGVIFLTLRKLRLFFTSTSPNTFPVREIDSSIQKRWKLRHTANRVIVLSAIFSFGWPNIEGVFSGMWLSFFQNEWQIFPPIFCPNNYGKLVDFCDWMPCLIKVDIEKKIWYTKCFPQLFGLSFSLVMALSTKIMENFFPNLYLL